ncbi:RluA family pseudouridine synthase [Caproiciproducens sp. NJN-50]|uniref:RluA family pseudouridine synthase n=1 Tax=Acutalibacteraceae TaxID=3082771 RepID=UPI000FFE0134|nr:MULTISPECIES: RluA family pseudouridine synthase [Acutalibacteraceae]QAT49679.1 RluA family pseudouridine synthase [Caproiciproducens sp. NJN-50]
MRELRFTVPSCFQGSRLKSFLREYCGISTRLLAKLKREPMGIAVNGRHAIATDRLQKGDLICLRLPQDEKIPESENLPFPVVFEDQDLLVVNKPAGMPMYPCPGHDRDSLSNAYSNYCAVRGEPSSFRPVYRLDRDTTGLVVLAKHSYAASALAGNVRKTYLAVCEGILRDSGKIEQPIGMKEGSRIQRTVRPDGRYALTRWRSLSAGNGLSLLALRLKTGRTHQIRVHLSNCGHPLAGDDFYGGSLSLIRRQALHCAEIRFVHPVTKQKIRFVQRLPEDMEKLFLFMQQSVCKENIE